MLKNTLTFSPWQKLHDGERRSGLNKGGIYLIASNWAKGEMDPTLYQNDWWYVGTSTNSIGNALTRFAHTYLNGGPQLRAAKTCRKIMDDLNLSPAKTLDSLYFTYAEVENSTETILRYDAMQLIDYYAIVRNDHPMGNVRRHVSK